MESSIKHLRGVVPVLALIAVVLLSGCFEEEEEDTAGFVGGEKGLKVSFLDLPTEIFQNVEFDIELVLDNKGEEDVGAGEVYINLNNANSFNVPSDKVRIQNKDKLTRTIDLAGTGGREFVKYDDAKYISPILTPESPVPLSVDICYPYQTTAVSDVCVAKMSDSTICNPKEEKEVFNSGSPIHVTGVKQILSLYTGGQFARVGISFEIEAKDSGAYYGLDDSCNELSDERVVSINSIEIGNEKWIVDPNNLALGANDLEKWCGNLKIRLNEDGEGKIQCNLPISYLINQGDYSERLTIKLGYHHTQTVTEDIKVIPI